MEIKDLILEILHRAEEPMTVPQIKNEIYFEAVKEAYGVSSFSIKMVRECLRELIKDKKIEEEKIQTTFAAYKETKNE